MAFIRNCWYMVAWDHEIPAEGLFSRTVIGVPLLLFRKASGDIAALEDRCCHRLAPLSMGRREGDCVRCGYHGMKFDASGRRVGAELVILQWQNGEPRPVYPESLATAKVNWPKR